MKSKFYLALLVFIFMPFLLYAADETLTITTYYPSPYGSYNEFKVASNTYLAYSSGSVGIGTTNPSEKLEIRKASETGSNPGVGAFLGLRATDAITNGDKVAMTFNTASSYMASIRGQSVGTDETASFRAEQGRAHREGAGEVRGAGGAGRDDNRHRRDGAGAVAGDTDIRGLCGPDGGGATVEQDSVRPGEGRDGGGHRRGD